MKLCNVNYYFPGSPGEFNYGSSDDYNYGRPRTKPAAGYWEECQDQPGFECYYYYDEGQYYDYDWGEGGHQWRARGEISVSMSILWQYVRNLSISVFVFGSFNMELDGLIYTVLMAQRVVSLVCISSIQKIRHR